MLAFDRFTLYSCTNEHHGRRDRHAARAVAARRGPGGGRTRATSRAPASGCSRSAAAPRGSSPRPTRRCASAPGSARPTRSPPRSCRTAPAAATTRSSRSPAPARPPRSPTRSPATTSPTAPPRSSRSTTRPSRDAADAAIVLDFADEESVVQTRFATSALTLLREHVAPGARGARGRRRRRGARASRCPVADLAAYDQWTFLGRGWTVGLAAEAALKMREAAQAWTESYPLFEYRHGPIAIAAPGRVDLVARPARPTPTG